MRSLVVMTMMAMACWAQDENPVTTQVAPLGIPCEPGDTLPLGPGFPMVCPPVEEQGVMVFVKTTDASTLGYQATVRYTNAAGEQNTSEQTIARNADGDWTIGVFKIGRVKTANLPGITIDGVDVTQLTSLDPAGTQTASSKKAKSKK